MLAGVPHCRRLNGLGAAYVLIGLLVWMAALLPGTSQHKKSSTETCDVPLRTRITSTLTPLLPLQTSNPAGIQCENKSRKPGRFEPTSAEVIAPLSPTFTRLARRVKLVSHQATRLLKDRSGRR